MYFDMCYIIKGEYNINGDQRAEDPYKKSKVLLNFI